MNIDWINEIFIDYFQVELGIEVLYVVDSDNNVVFYIVDDEIVDMDFMEWYG